MSLESYYEAQQAVIGSLLIDGAVAGLVMSRTRAEDYTGVCRTLYQAARELFAEGKPIDPVTVRSRVGEEYGKTLLELMDITPTAANCALYIDILLERSKVERCRALGAALNEAVTLEDVQKAVSAANRILGGRSNVRVVSAEQGFRDFYRRQSEPANLIAWGIEKIDNTLRVEYGDFIVLGGYPSAGKTAFSLQLAWNQARERRVGYFSLETTPEKLIDRTVAAVCGVDFDHIKGHTLTDEDWERCGKRAETFVGRKLELIQASDLTVVDIQALALAGRYEIVYVDYLQLVAPEDRRRSEFEQVTQISKCLHTMAQTTGITVCALSQLTRPKESGEQERTPGLHSLRQSGQIEQDADGVMLLFKTLQKNPESSRTLKIAKNKEGPAGGTARLLLDGPHQRFRVVEPFIADAHDRQQGRKSGPQPEPALPPAPAPERMRQETLYELPDSEPVPWEDRETMGNAAATQ